MLWIGFILAMACAILALAGIFAVASRQNLPVLNNQIDAKDEYIRKIESRNRQIKEDLLVMLKKESILTNEEIFKEIRYIINRESK